MTERLELFRKQALRPYKTAIACMAVVLVLACVGGGYIIDQQANQISKLIAKTENQDKFMNDAVKRWVTDSTETAKKFEEYKDSIQKELEKRGKSQGGGGGRGRGYSPTPAPSNLTSMFDKVKPSVYAVITSIYFANSERRELIGRSQGTGFLLADGRFVTARHCVEPWLFDNGELQTAYALSNESEGALTLYAEILAVNKNGETMQFKSSNFRVNRSYDSPVSVPYEIEGETVKLQGRVAFGTKASLGNDWAYISTSRKGTILDGASMSSNLKSGTTVHMFGFPKSLGINDGKNIVDPIYNGLSVSRDGLDDSRCIMINQGVDHGNSGGPVFVQNGGNLYVIGIVSRGSSQSSVYNHLVPMCNLR